MTAYIVVILLLFCKVDNGNYLLLEIFYALLYNLIMTKGIQIHLNKLLTLANVDKDAIVGVALSGGMDSIALCHVLKMSGVSIVAINVEHGIRGESSVKDSQFVKDWCEESGITFYGYQVDVPTFAKEMGYTIEQGARVLRYQCFEDALKKGVCDVVALAHHLDDQVETMLMRILRGTGVNGLQGMRAVRGKYIRPLLEYSREDIENYINENNLPFVSDETNADTRYTRNFLREEIARLKERFPSLIDSFTRLSNNAKEESDFLNSLLPAVECVNGEVAIDINDMHVALAKRLIYKAISALGVTQDIEDRHIALILQLNTLESGKKLELPHGVIAHKCGDEIVFCLQNNNENNDMDKICKVFEIGTHEDIGVEIEVVTRDKFESEFSTQRQNGVLYFDLDKLPNEVIFRRRQDGDFINKFGGGKKSLGDFLTDKKVPLRHRDSLVVLAKDSEVYIVIGVEISGKIKVDDTTKNIAKIHHIGKG